RGIVKRRTSDIDIRIQLRSRTQVDRKEVDIPFPAYGAADRIGERDQHGSRRRVIGLQLGFQGGGRSHPCESLRKEAGGSGRSPTLGPAGGGEQGQAEDGEQ